MYAPVRPKETNLKEWWLKKLHFFLSLQDHPKTPQLYTKQNLIWLYWVFTKLHLADCSFIQIKFRVVLVWPNNILSFYRCNRIAFATELHLRVVLGVSFGAGLMGRFNPISVQNTLFAYDN